MKNNIIQKLKNFEDEQEKKLEKNKKEYLVSLEKKKKDLLNTQDKEILSIVTKKKDILAKAQENAKKDAKATIDEFHRKIKALDKAKNRKKDAVKLIFDNFLDNV